MFNNGSHVMSKSQPSIFGRLRDLEEAIISDPVDVQVVQDRLLQLVKILEDWKCEGMCHPAIRQKP